MYDSISVDAELGGTCDWKYLQLVAQRRLVEEYDGAKGFASKAD
jgi:hypothetical protein